MKTTGEILKSLREEKGIPMEQMVEQLKLYGVNPSKSMISRWENDKADPSMGYARVLTKYFNVTLDYIIGLTDSRTPATRDKRIETIAAHFEGDEFTEDDKDDIENFIKYVLSKKNK